jgi:hypothetical protein
MRHIVFSFLSFLALASCSSNPLTASVIAQKDTRVFVEDGLVLEGTKEILQTPQNKKLFGCVFIGRVKNISSTPRLLPTANISYRNGTSETSTGAAMIDAHIVNPGESAWFKITRMGSEPCGRCLVTFKSQLTDLKGQRFLKLTHLKAERKRGTYWLNGKVSNPSPTVAYTPRVVCRTYSDAAKTKVVNYGVGFPGFLQPIKPGKSAAFDLFVPDELGLGKSHVCSVESRPNPDPVTTIKR